MISVPPVHAPTAAHPRLELQGVTKRFSAVVANQEIDLALAPGEIHALLGENGAGKSTLVKILCGLLHPDHGRILWDGRPVVIASPHEARRLGIGVVFQHFVLFETLTVAENIRLGLDQPEPLPVLAQRIRAKAEQFGLAIDPSRPVHTLSMGQRQRVEILRCLLQDPRLLVMDEPTSVLTPQEAETLFHTLRRLREAGSTILFISHKLQEILSLCDRATILRRGRVVGVRDPRRESAASLAALMVGAEVGEIKPAERLRTIGTGTGPVEAPRLVIEGLTTNFPDPFAMNLTDLHLTVQAGEIVGIAGVAGNGQRELMRALNGEWRGSNPAAIRLDGRPIGALNPAGRRRLGMGMVPEQRLGRGMVPEMTLAANTLLAAAAGGGGLVRHGLIHFSRAEARARAIIREFGVTAAGPSARAGSLSGGNLQKFLVGREVALQPRLLVAASPTWGVDVAAALDLERNLLGLARAGAAVVVVSQDLDELFAIADRIAVIFRGRLSRPKSLASTSIEEIGALMGGRNDDGIEAGGPGERGADCEPHPAMVEA